MVDYQIDLKREADIERRSAAVNSCYLSTPVIEHILYHIGALRRRGVRSDGSTMCMQISGPTGSGKSMIFTHYLQGADTVATDHEVPVIRARMPSPFVFSHLLDRLIHHYGAMTFGKTETLDKKLARLRTLVTEKRTTLILIDDVQHIVDQKERGARLPYYAADQIKTDMLDGLRVPIVFNGLPISDFLYERNPQLAMRRKYRNELKAFSWHDEIERERFSFLIGLFAEKAEFRNCEDLEPELIERIWHATQGIPGDANTLIRNAIEVATLRKLRELDSSVLAEAHAMSGGKPGWRNVFLMPFAQVRNGGAILDESRTTRLTKRIARV